MLLFECSVTQSNCAKDSSEKRDVAKCFVKRHYLVNFTCAEEEKIGINSGIETDMTTMLNKYKL